LFENLFKRKSIIRRHQQAPLAEERGRYLAFKAEGGAARITLCATANYLLAVVSCLALEDTIPISRETIEAAASRWARSAPGYQKATLRARFTSVACTWLRSSPSPSLKPPPGILHPRSDFGIPRTKPKSWVQQGFPRRNADAGHEETPMRNLASESFPRRNADAGHEEAPMSYEETPMSLVATC